ncbi:hypothetical protein ACP70R_043880 [Stipagrostis hirtigluma subsp. patula]
MCAAFFLDAPTDRSSTMAYALAVTQPCSIIFSPSSRPANSTINGHRVTLRAACSSGRRRPGKRALVGSRSMLEENMASSAVVDRLVFALNGRRYEVAGGEVEPSMPLLEFIRTRTPFKGPKLGCGEGPAKKV